MLVYMADSTLTRCSGLVRHASLFVWLSRLKGLYVHRYHIGDRDGFSTHLSMCAGGTGITPCYQVMTPASAGRNAVLASNAACRITIGKELCITNTDSLDQGKF